MLARRDRRVGTRCGQGQQNRDLSALTYRPAIHDNLAAMISHHSPTFGQAEPEPPASFAPTEKRIKNVLAYLVGNAGPVVPNNNLDSDLLVHRSIANFDLDVTAVVASFDRVLHDRMNRAAELRRIANDLGRLTVE